MLYEPFYTGLSDFWSLHLYNPGFLAPTMNLTFTIVSGTYSSPHLSPNTPSYASKWQIPLPLMLHIANFLFCCVIVNM